MAGKFPQEAVEELLKQCHRRCCVCHRFCGVKIETDHIDPGGSDDIVNAIPVCFECHAEIHSYNDKHPRGRKYRPNELHKHKEQWLQICRERPEVFLNVPRRADVGPLQALIDELEYNHTVAVSGQVGGFMDIQFRRATREGILSLLHDELKASIFAAYAAIGKARQLAEVAAHTGMSSAYAQRVNDAQSAAMAAKVPISAAKDTLLKYLVAK